MADPMERCAAALAQSYRIDRVAGVGGMATVYLAEDLKHHRNVAIKVLRPELAATLGAERFLREVTIAANLTHPHILPVHDSGEAEGFLYYVMPYVEGQSLRQRLLREGELPVPEAVRILRDVADAMAHAHERGVVHRDIKPENVMLAGRHALVTDFGVAKAVSEATGRQALTTVGVALGTPSYMAPEQAAADPHTDHRADIYAFGVLAYELLAGRPPFTGTTAQAVIAAHMTTAAEPVTQHRANVPPALAALIMKCLEKKPADRWQRAEDIVLHLETLLTPTAITPAEVQPFRAAGRRRARRAALMAAGAVLLLTAGFAARTLLGGSGDDASRVAVLRFENRTGADSLDAFGLILADVVTNDMVRSGIVNAVPTASLEATIGSVKLAGVAPDPRVIAREARAGIVVTGRYFLQRDSIVVHAEMIDLARNRPATAIAPVSFALADERAGLDLVRQRLLVLLSARLNPMVGHTAALSDLPVSLTAYRKYADGLERFGANDFATALRLFYDAHGLDSASATVILHLAVTEWNANTDIRRVDSLLRLLEPRRSEMQPVDRMQYDYLRAWTDGDLEGALRAARAGAEIHPLYVGMAAQDAFRANRWDEAWRFAQAGVRSELARKSVVRIWEMYTRTLHHRGDFERELRAARQGLAEAGEQTALIQWEVRALAALGRMDELVPRLQALRARSPANVWFRGAARELRLHGHPALADSIGLLAVEWYGEQLAVRPTAALRSTLAGTLFDLGRVAEARAIYDSLAHGDPAARAALGYLGIIAAREGDATRAEAMVERLGRDTTPYIFGNNVYWQGVVAANLGRCEQAVTYFSLATRRGTSYLAYWENPLLAGIEGCPVFRRFREPKR